MTELLLLVIAIVLVLILVGIRQLVTKAEQRAYLQNRHFEKMNEQLVDIRTRLRDHGYMTSEERQYEAAMHEAGIFKEPDDLD